MKEAVKARFNAILAFLKEQLRQTSTLRGIALLAGSFALFAGFPPDTVLMLVTFAAGLLAVALPDRLS